MYAIYYRVSKKTTDFSQVSIECVDLMTSMMQKDPTKRPTADEALKFEWFDKLSTNVKDIHMTEV